MGKGRELPDRIYALEDEGDVRTFYDEAAGDYDENIDGWVCVLRITRPGFVP